MFKYTTSFILVASVAVGYLVANDNILTIGQDAPLFQATNIEGKEFDLKALRGKVVVLEWKNHKCPYVVKHYSTMNMQELQSWAKVKGVEWISIVSSSPGKQGHLSAEAHKELVVNEKSNATHVILDESGDIGRMYHAKTTPHMYVINEAGKLVYEGAIDDHRSARQKGLWEATNYVKDAVRATLEGQEVEIAQTPPYGCSVKY